MPQKWIKDQVPLKWTTFNNIFGIDTRICFSISSISVALSVLSISVALGPSIHIRGTSSRYMFSLLVMNTGEGGVYYKLDGVAPLITDPFEPIMGLKSEYDVFLTLIRLSKKQVPISNSLEMGV